MLEEKKLSQEEMSRIEKQCEKMVKADVQEHQECIVGLLKRIEANSIPCWRHDVYFKLKDHFYDIPIYNDEFEIIKTEKKTFTKNDLAHNTSSGGLTEDVLEHIGHIITDNFSRNGMKYRMMVLEQVSIKFLVMKMSNIMPEEAQFYLCNYELAQKANESLRKQAKRRLSEITEEVNKKSNKIDWYKPTKWQRAHILKILYIGYEMIENDEINAKKWKRNRQ
ncbi:uncharacterized protein [Clytia hemisphaerica]|uniref:uncharacterized protein n=1 Tax=Clytia hemisphaerica TaxID=252671 RepID=UPI0034D69F3F